KPNSFITKPTFLLLSPMGKCVRISFGIWNCKRQRCDCIAWMLTFSMDEKSFSKRRNCPVIDEILKTPAVD
ncbi:unnamed protein product, partial [Rotaria magnacalcarata]